ncbi:MAG: 50S ribosomal protein L24 [Candidatus Riflebacteria bacterium]|nr:50S ribosomal protein L24 [Candidatus Riflebacteria bacterium]
MRKNLKKNRAVAKPHVKKDDTVLVLSGDDSGKKGRVLQVYKGRGMVVVEGVNYVKKHSRPSKKMGKGGIVKKEGPIAISNVALFCSKCNDVTRAVVVAHTNEEISRVCRECKEPIGRK